ncbi:unnamed protein product [Prunus armeniaca]|uniref:Uncharacterized protein n=1 Tax=Prunus armeniaca TaxID=36596 RepID=A0A6J5W3G6_PRUAR|nr:unnamed protein product [Prunus armeniaca]
MFIYVTFTLIPHNQSFNRAGCTLVLEVEVEVDQPPHSRGSGWGGTAHGGLVSAAGEKERRNKNKHKAVQQ